MNEHAGPACALSVLIVGAFAILLHDKEQPPTSPNSIARQAAEVPSRPVEPAVIAPAPPPQKPAAEASVPAPKPAREVEKVAPKRPIEVPKETIHRVVQRPVPAETVRPPTQPRGPFTVVEAGESLADVARRVYGSTEAAESLWKANRDQISKPDSPLARGTLLRTP